MGVAVGDYDNDGCADLFVTAYGRCHPLSQQRQRHVYRRHRQGRCGDARMDDRRRLVRLRQRRSSRSLRLQLRPVRTERGLLCADKTRDGTSTITTCIPHLFKPTQSVLFHNNGDGTFTASGRGTDIDRSAREMPRRRRNRCQRRRPDWICSSPTTPRRTSSFVNRGRKGWQERGLLPAWPTAPPAGAVGHGRRCRRMSMATAGRTCSWPTSTTKCIRSTRIRGRPLLGRAREHGLAEATRLLSGWGLKFFDVDNDGRVDLLWPTATRTTRSQSARLTCSTRNRCCCFATTDGAFATSAIRPDRCFRSRFPHAAWRSAISTTTGTWTSSSAATGRRPCSSAIARGATTTGSGLSLQGVTCNRDAIGARITWSAGGVSRSRLKTGGGSYLSSHDPREVLGLGTATTLDWLEIKWPLPSGRTERLTNLPIDRYSRRSSKDEV